MVRTKTEKSFFLLIRERDGQYPIPKYLGFFDFFAEEFIYRKKKKETKIFFFFSKMGICGSVEHTNSNETQSDDVEPDTRDKIDTVVVNWNMAGINENAYVLSFSK